MNALGKCLRRTGNRLDAVLPQRRINGFAELPIGVMLNVANSQPIGTGMPDELLRLLRDPCDIGKESRRREDDAPCFDVEEGQDNVPGVTIATN
jgi:hypothetical protein